MNRFHTVLFWKTLIAQSRMTLWIDGIGATMVVSELPRLPPSREEKLVKIRRTNHITELSTDDDCASCTSIFDDFGVERSVFFLGKVGCSDEDRGGDEGCDFGGRVLGRDRLDHRGAGFESSEHVSGHFILK